MYEFFNWEDIASKTSSKKQLMVLFGTLYKYRRDNIQLPDAKYWRTTCNFIAAGIGAFMVVFCFCIIGLTWNKITKQVLFVL